jgi:AraC-like DNA-binding protein
MTIGLITILLFQLLFHIKHSPMARWLSVMGISCLAYLLMAFSSQEGTFLNSILRMFAPAAAVAILGMSKCLFLEEPKLSKPEWIVTVAYMGLSIINVVPGQELVQPEVAAKILFSTTPQVLMISLVLSALYFTLEHLHTDLVEARRRVRIIFILIIAFYSTVFLVSGLIYDYQFPHWLLLTHQIALLITWSSVHIWLFKFRAGEVVNMTGQAEATGLYALVDAPPLERSREQADSPLPVEEELAVVGGSTEKFSPVDKRILTQLEALMSEAKAYRKPGLTISSLANLIELQEHQLRRVINQNLGYRNFNKYLNQYRIAEAAAILSDVSAASTSISVIAMDVGFNSLAPFNRAFKASKGLSPRDYRKKYCA